MKTLTNFFYNYMVDIQSTADLNLSVMLSSGTYRKKIMRLFFLDTDVCYVSKKFKERSKLCMTLKDISTLMKETAKDSDFMHSFISNPHETMKICCTIFEPEIKKCWTEAARIYFKNLYQEAI